MVGQITRILEIGVDQKGAFTIRVTKGVPMGLVKNALWKCLEGVIEKLAAKKGHSQIVTITGQPYMLENKDNGE